MSLRFIPQLEISFFPRCRSPGSNKLVDTCSFFFSFSSHSWHFPEPERPLSPAFPLPLVLGESSLFEYPTASCPFPCKKKKKSSTVSTTTSNFVYFSFLSCERNSRVFQETSERGGCDSLPLVVASTSKQRESPLSYALHFLCIISHQMCCAGERELGLPGRSVEKSPRQRLIECRGSITAVCDCEGQNTVAFLCLSIIPS